MSALHDIAVLAGLGCVAYGGYQFHPALPWLVCGGAAAAWGYVGAVSKLRKGDKK